MKDRKEISSAEFGESGEKFFFRSGAGFTLIPAPPSRDARYKTDEVLKLLGAISSCPRTQA